MFVHSVLLLFSGQVQGSIRDGGSLSVYQRCLHHHLAFMRQANFQAHTIYVRKAGYLDIADGLFQDYHVKFLSDSDLYDRTADNRSIGLIQFTPVKLGEGFYSFTVVYFRVSRHENHYTYTQGCGSTFRLVFNCQTNLFEVNLIGQGEYAEA